MAGDVDVSLLSPQLIGSVTLLSIGGARASTTISEVTKALTDAIRESLKPGQPALPSFKHPHLRRKQREAFEEQVMRFLPDLASRDEKVAVPTQAVDVGVAANQALDWQLSPLSYETSLSWRVRLGISLECAAKKYPTEANAYEPVEWAQVVLEKFEKRLWNSVEGVAFLREVEECDFRAASVNVLQDLSVSVRWLVRSVALLLVSGGAITGLDLGSVIHFH